MNHNEILKERAARVPLTEEQEFERKKIRRLIRQGKYPRYIFAMGKDMKMERKTVTVYTPYVVKGKRIRYKKAKRSFRMISTMAVFMNGAK